MPFVIETDPQKRDLLVGRAIAKPKRARVSWIGLLRHFEPAPPSPPVRRRLHAARRYLLALHDAGDEARAAPIVQMARNEGHIIWSHADFTSTHDSEAMLRGASGVVLFCSAGAFGSSEVIRELARARRCHKPILPLFIDDIYAPSDVMQMLSAFTPIRVSEPGWKPRFLDALARLEMGLRKPSRRRDDYAAA
ncbi:MAG TPA: hypothetical protein VG841_12090 [Caulobacterales bacterium]|nr:hypothetical protein [Caulobacterales bacterium]